MKQMKFFLLALTVLMGVSFTSCMDNDNESPYDYLYYMTVQEGFLGDITLLSDEGYKFQPSNPVALKTTSGEYVERALVGLKFPEGTQLTADKAVTYPAEIVAAQSLYTKNMCNMPDTIQHEYPLVSLDKGAWAANGYLTLAFAYNGYPSSPNSFDLVPEKAEGNVLTVSLKHSYGKENVNNPLGAFMCFKIPSIPEINGILERKETPSTLTPSDNEIKIVIEAKGSNQTLKVDDIKLKL